MKSLRVLMVAALLPVALAAITGRAGFCRRLPAEQHEVHQVRRWQGRRLHPLAEYKVQDTRKVRPDPAKLRPAPADPLTVFRVAEHAAGGSKAAPYTARQELQGLFPSRAVDGHGSQHDHHGAHAANGKAQEARLAGAGAERQHKNRHQQIVFDDAYIADENAKEAADVTSLPPESRR